MFFIIYPRTFDFYLSNMEYNGYIEEYQFVSNIEYEKILSLSEASLLAFITIVLLIVANSKLEIFQFIAILELTTSLGIFF